MLFKSLIFLNLATNILAVKSEWLNHLTNYIRKDAKVDQVVFSIEGELKDVDPRTEIIIRTISSNFPVKIIHFSPDVKVPELAIGDPKTHLFILFHGKEEDQDLTLLDDPINFVSNLSPSRSRPKCLIILLQKVESRNYEKLLRHMWSHDFLDTTILTLSTTRSEQSHFLMSHSQEVITIHHFNPHSDTVTKEEYSSKIQWFPDKVRDLKGQKIGVAFQHYPPHMILKRDHAGRKVITGLGWIKMEALSKYMNFTLVRIDHESGGRMNCENKYNSTGVYRNLIYREATFFAMEFGRFAACDETFYEWGRGTMKTKICLVVPVLPKETFILSVGWKILNLFAVISMPLIVWAFARLVHFDNRNWRLIYLVQIFLGSSVPREPQRIAERVLFAIVIIMCFFYSTLIFTAFTDIGLKKKSAFELESTEDVIASNIDTEISINIFNLVYNNANKNERRLLNKAVLSSNPNYKCFQQLIAHRNIICVGRPESAEYFLLGKRDKCGSQVAKILREECLSNTLSGTIMAARSPYVSRVDQIIQRLIQAGITEKWNSMYSDKSENTVDTEFSCINKREESSQILRQIFFVLIFGFSFSILTFFVELFSLWLLKYRGRNFRIADHLSRT